ncbi:hypothetical protein H4R34_001880 [Dimargaris verticillata]|uniref:Cell division cycle protein 123 n=1 Tax=Dimargaris verticillata TaxID=2761393 RepID=A0A9W8BAH4_9FUNG|nr:hypothetical protein H4R34_001880 [Dimargaris verticillata]
MPDDATAPLPPVTVQDVLNCAFSHWYPNFRTSTIKSLVIKPLPPALLQYLKQDNVVLPAHSDADSDDVGSTTASAEHYDDEADNDDSDAVDAVPDLSEATALIQEAIDALGGDVFPRLAWSSPRDAVWITATQSLRCTSPDDVYLVLKSSDRVTDELDAPFAAATLPPTDSQGYDPELVLRRWSNLNPALEFRCFVLNQRLTHITQMDLNHYSFLAEEQDRILSLITQFFTDTVLPRFPSRHYAVDVYVKSTYEKVYIVDFNILSPSTTDPILFAWDELLTPNKPVSEQQHQPTLRLFPADTDGLRFSSARYSQNRFPVELTATNYQEGLDKFIETVRSQQPK